jgi:hypothetical protein
VTCGALTTILGSCFLINCVILFFSRFGTFIVFTLSAAYLHALLVFPAALAIFGPTTTNTNDWRRLRNWLDGRRNGRDYKPTAVSHLMEDLTKDQRELTTDQKDLAKD